MELKRKLFNELIRAIRRHRRKRQRTGRDPAIEKLSKVKIPGDPEQFYQSFGPFLHPVTGLPVATLAPYQVEVWRMMHQHKRLLVIKSNKIGLTSSTLMADFQLAILPKSNPLLCMGREILIIAQNEAHAKEHIRTLKKMILGSNYAKWLITTPIARAMRGEASKANQLYIHNPDDPDNPTRIIAFGISKAGNLLSLKNVKHIHVSDATAAQGDIRESLNAAVSRLALTRGTMIIETVPGRPSGAIYDMYEQAKADETKRKLSNTGSSSVVQSGSFKMLRIPASEAVNAGVMTQEFLDEQLAQLGPMFNQYYGAEFVLPGGSIFSSAEIDYCIREYDLEPREGALRTLSADWGFAGSKTALLGGELRSNEQIHILYEDEISRATTTEVINEVSTVYHEGQYTNCCADGSQVGIIEDLSSGSSRSNRPPINIEGVAFGKELQPMLQKLVHMIREGKIVIHPKFTSLIRQLKTAQYDKYGNLDKSTQSYDLFDALLMLVSHMDSGEVFMDKL